MGCVLLIIVFRNGQRSMVNFVCRAWFSLSRQNHTIIRADDPCAARSESAITSTPDCGLVLHPKSWTLKKKSPT